MEIREYKTLRECEDAHWWYDGLRNVFATSLRAAAGREAISEIRLPRRSPPIQWRAPRNDVSFKILDIGCGTGGNLAFLSRNCPGAGTIGIDINPLALSLAAERPECRRLVRAPAEMLPFADGSFDAVLLLDVLYIQGLEEDAVLREAGRVLKPGGFFLINTAAFEFLRGEHDRAVSTRHRYTKKELRASMTRAGFEILKISYWNFFLFPAIFLVRRFGGLLRAGKGGARSDVYKMPSLVNSVLKGLLSLERAFFFTTGLPWGVSLFAVVRKPYIFSPDAK